MITIRNLTMQFNDKLLFENVSYQLKMGQTYILNSKSGSGKTTFLKLLLNMEQPTSGTIDHDLQFAVVFQEPSLLDEASVYTNLAIALPKAMRKNFGYDKYLKLVDLEVSLSQKVTTLSFGMKQRLAILQVLLLQRDVYCFDEACKGLDEATKTKVISLIQEKTKGKMVIWISHDQQEWKHFKEYQEIRLNEK